MSIVGMVVALPIVSIGWLRGRAELKPPLPIAAPRDA
jgi:hypothetical protein